jgi:hypothetical protein
MANPNTRETLKQYALRRLGKPVIEINVDNDQLEDRLDEALQFYAQFHYEGIRRTYLKYKLTAADKLRLKNPTQSSEVATDIASGNTTTWYEQNNYLSVPDTVLAVTNIFSFSDKANMNMFDVRYQLRLNDLYDFASTSVINYDMVLRHLDFLDQILVGKKPIRFQQHDNRLYIDMDWTNDLTEDEFLIIDCYRKLDPATYTDVFNDIWLKRYTTALIKKQWGQNLSKFDGVTMIGNVTLNGTKIMQEAEADIEKLEKEIRDTYETAPAIMVG